MPETRETTAQDLMDIQTANGSECFYCTAIPSCIGAYEVPANGGRPARMESERPCCDGCCGHEQIGGSCRPLNATQESADA